MEVKDARRMIAQCASREEKDRSVMSITFAMISNANHVKMRCILEKVTGIFILEAKNMRVNCGEEMRTVSCTSIWSRNTMVDKLNLR